MQEYRLKCVSIEDYRCIRKLDVELPGVGLLLLTGANGLGKSSFLEAIEWGLTGDVERRLRNTRERGDRREYRARELGPGERARRYRVELTFDGSDELVVKRAATLSGGRYRPAGTSYELIRNALVMPGWRVPDPESLRTYLHFTHLLSQSRVVQPLFRNTHDQWHAAKGLFRLFGLEDARARFGRLKRGNSALSARVKLLGEAASRARDAHSRFAREFDELERRRRVLAMEAPPELGDLYGQLVEVGVEAKIELPPARVPTEASVQAGIEAIQRGLHERRVELASELEVRWGFHDAVGEHTRLMAERETLESSLPDLTKRAAEAKQALDAQEEVRRTNERHHDELEGQHRTLLSRLEGVQRVRRVWPMLDDVRASEPQISMLLDQVPSEFLSESAVETGRGIETVFDRIEAAYEDLNTLRSFGFEQVQRGALLGLLGERSRLDRAFENAESDLRKLQTREANTHRMVEQIRQRSDEITGLIARLASLIEPNDHSCPLCTSPFEGVGDPTRSGTIRPSLQRRHLAGTGRSAMRVARRGTRPLW